MDYFKIPKTEIYTILNIVGGEAIKIVGDSVRQIAGVASLENAKSDHLAFCYFYGQEGYNKISSSNAGIVICSPELPNVELLASSRTLLFVDNPMLCFAKCLKYFFGVEHKKKAGIHETVILPEGCNIDPTVYLGPHVILDDMIEIGPGTQIENGVRVYSRIQIGKNVKLRSNCSIGVDGMAYAKNEKGIYEEFFHLGSVKIGDNVDIGANSWVVRGILTDTIIESGTKIGNFVNIGHNVRVGKNCFISAKAILCGSVEVEDNCWIAPQSSIRNHVRIGKGSTVGLGAVVVRDVAENTTVVGNPAKILENEDEKNDSPIDHSKTCVIGEGEEN